MRTCWRPNDNATSPERIQVILELCPFYFPSFAVYCPAKTKMPDCEGIVESHCAFYCSKRQVKKGCFVSNAPLKRWSCYTILCKEDTLTYGIKYAKRDTCLHDT